MEDFKNKVAELAEILLQMKRAYPNGYHEAQRLFEELSDPSGWEE